MSLTLYYIVNDNISLEDNFQQCYVDALKAKAVYLHYIMSVKQCKKKIILWMDSSAAVRLLLFVLLSLLLLF